MTAWKQAPIVDNGEPLVPIGPFSEYPELLSSAIYAGERIDSPYAPDGLPGSLLTPFVRLGVAERLRAVAAGLPEGLGLLVWDSYRSIETQRALYDYYERELGAAHPDWSPTEISEHAQRFVSLPSSDPTRPSPHNTGGVVDLTIVHLHHGPWFTMQRALQTIAAAKVSNDWRSEYRATMVVMHLVRSHSTVLEMGTAFDEVAPATAADYFDGNPADGSTQRPTASNRALLRARMQDAGFHAYEEEWWHFSYGDQMWAHARGGSAMYGAIELSDSNRDFEHRRRVHHRLSRAWADGYDIEGLVPERYAGAAAFARAAMERMSDPRLSSHPVAHRL